MTTRKLTAEEAATLPVTHVMTIEPEELKLQRVHRFGPGGALYWDGEKWLPTERKEVYEL